MEIKVAKNIGFCWGVKRALDITFKALEDSRPELHSLGQVIHNPQMSAELSEKGLVIAKDVKDVKSGRFLVRSHGIAPLLMQDLADRKIEIIDATCPFVKRTQSLIDKLREEGYAIIIIGEPDHPEVKGLIGYAGTDTVVVNKVSQLDNCRFVRNKKWAIVAQSTQSQKNFQEIVSSLIEEKFPELRILFTICQETLKREELAQDLAKSCDLMLVVGGFNSANTRRLKEIVQACGRLSYQIENAQQIEPHWFNSVDSVGIISGTSTPQYVVDEVIKRINELKICGIRKTTPNLFGLPDGSQA